MQISPGRNLPQPNGSVICRKAAVYGFAINSLKTALTSFVAAIFLTAITAQCAGAAAIRPPEFQHDHLKKILLNFLS